MKKETQNGQGIKVRYIILMALVSISLGVMILFLSGNPSPPSMETSSNQQWGVAPDFTLPDLNGKNVSLSEYRGKVVLLNIWATWCPPCVDEMPSMEKLYQELKGADFELLTVSVDTNGVKAVSPFMKKHKLSFPVLTDTAGLMKRLYQTTGIPESLILDRKGNIVEKVVGPRDWASPQAFQFFRQLMQQ